MSLVAPSTCPNQRAIDAASLHVITYNKTLVRTESWEHVGAPVMLTSNILNMTTVPSTSSRFRVAGRLRAPLISDIAVVHSCLASNMTCGQWCIFARAASPTAVMAAGRPELGERCASLTRHGKYPPWWLSAR
jgi:hypothetical protein